MNAAAAAADPPVPDDEPGPPLVSAVTFRPDLTHPYQLGRHGATAQPPAGLRDRALRDWRWRYDNGRRTHRLLTEWRARIRPGEPLPVIIREWEENRRRMGLGG